jgi:hypothetical protein
MFAIDSSVSVAPRCGLDDPGIESRWGWDFSHPSAQALGLTQPPVQSVPGLFCGLQRPGRGVNHPSPSSAEVEDRVELYLYSPFETSWPVLEWNLPLSLYPPLQWVSVEIPPASKRLGCEADQLRAFTAMIKNRWSFTSTRTYLWRGA